MKPIEDPNTRAYFDHNTPHFSNAARLQFAVDHVNASALSRGSLVDIGCGDGATLEVFQRGTSLSRLVGLDVSDRLLELARARLGCETVCGSILDRDLVAQNAGSFDFAVLSQILHHLIGKTRTSSFSLATEAVDHAFRLLRPGGFLILFEPAYRPRNLMTAVFWIKKTVSSLASGRIELSRRWANIGEPIVSYYTPQQLRNVILSTEEAEVTIEKALVRRRVGGLLEFTLLGLVARKVDTCDLKLAVAHHLDGA